MSILVKKIFTNLAKNIKVGDFTKRIYYLNGLKFDFIFSNQVLYYGGRKQLEKAIKEIDQVINPNGIVYFTLIVTQNYYYKNSVNLSNSDLRRITLRERLNEFTGERPKRMRWILLTPK